MRFDVIDGPLSDTEWQLVSVVGDEALNELFAFHVTLHARSKEARDASYGELQAGLVGRTVTLEMHAADTKRVGIIASLEIDPRGDAEDPLIVRATMRPRAWLLSHRKNTRIFQQKYVHEIASTVLAESGVAHRWLLGNTYPKRQLCTQYEETDLAFVQRILAEEGIFTFFEHASRFEPTPEPAVPETDGWAKAAAVAGIVGAVAGGIAPEVQSNAKASGVLGTIGSVANIFADAATKYVDPEADDPIKGSTGRGGVARSGPTDVFVFADSLTGYVDALAQLEPETNDPTPPKRDKRLGVEYRGSGVGFLENQVTKLLGARVVAPRKVEIRDYNFRKPMALLARTNETTEAAPDDAKLEVYEHHGEYEKPDIEDEQAMIRIEQLRASASTVRGDSTAPRMMPGFLLDFGHAPDPFVDTVYVPTRVHHEATIAESAADTKARPDTIADARIVEAITSVLSEIRNVSDIGVRRGTSTASAVDVRAIAKQALAGASATTRTYKNSFEWVESSVVFRPPLPPRIRHAVNETAVVVGPAGQAVYVDNYGRVKVQFHWDREHAYNENSSSWIRVLSTWAGAGFGFQFFPRVGMEVVVTFLGGDPDRPVISGALYNATHPTPEPLPQRFTRSGVRTESIPGGGGFNELSFEDAKGVERVFIHAQKDLHEIVNDEHTTTVRGAQTTTVGGAQKVGVATDQIVGAGGNATLVTGNNRVTHVGGDRVESTIRSAQSLVHGDSLAEVRGVSVRETVRDDMHVVRGDMSAVVYGRHALHVASKKDGVKGASTTYVDGALIQTATERILIRAEKPDSSNPSGNAETSTLRVECGDTAIELSHDTVKITAKKVEINAEESFTVTTKKAKIDGSEKVELTRAAATAGLDDKGWAVKGVDKVELKTTSSKLSLDKGKAEMTGSDGVTVKSPSIKMSSGNATDSASTSSDTKSETPPTKELKVAFVHPYEGQEDLPISGTRYRLIAGDFVKEATTTSDGEVTASLPEGTKQVQVILFVNERPDFAAKYPSPLFYDLQVEDDLHAASDLQGARIRLRNLGYTPGTDLDVKDPKDDPLTTRAIQEFQRERQIRISGKLDEDDTSKALDQVYGSVS